LSEERIDKIVIEQVDDDSAWDEPVRVNKCWDRDFEDYLREGVLEEVGDRAREEAARMPVDAEPDSKDKFIRKLLKRRTPKAREYVGDRKKLAEFIDQVREKINEQEHDPGPLDEVWDYLTLLLRLVQAYVRREYTEIPVKSLVLIVAALIYFVNPFDLVPDTIPVAGFIDDAVVLTWVIRQLRIDLDKFRAWEAARSEIPVV
jgi:uncharacterized membrane protein YkvA (DUF1232 family)